MPSWRSFLDIDFTPVESSNVAAIGYDEDDRTLYVKFHVKKGGRIVGTVLYQYDEVPALVVQAFLSAPSKGEFHWAHIRGRYTYRRVAF